MRTREFGPIERYLLLVARYNPDVEDILRWIGDVL
jgi:hypothetical protein